MLAGAAAAAREQAAEAPLAQGAAHAARAARLQRLQAAHGSGALDEGRRGGAEPGDSRDELQGAEVRAQLAALARISSGLAGGLGPSAGGGAPASALGAALGPPVGSGSLSLAELEQLAEDRRATRAAALECQLELMVARGSLAGEVRLAALVELKKVRLRALRAKVRREVQLEHWAAAEGQVDRAFHPGSFRRAPPKPLPLEHTPIGNTQVTLAQMKAIREVADAAAAATKSSHLKQKEAVAAAAQQARIRELQRLAREAKRKQREDFERVRVLCQARMEVIQARRAFLHQLCDHRPQMQKLVFAAAQKRHRQRNDAVMQWHGRERRRKIRMANARIMALKDNNIEEYLRMARETKNDRIHTLLNKTDGILVELGMKISEQRETTGVAVDYDEEGLNFQRDVREDREIGQAIVEGQQKYNALVHTNVEQVQEQPSNLQVGKLRPYQLGGLQWMSSLYLNGMNGILADEMGLGKTIQTISLVAWLMEAKQECGPHLIIAPKAVLSNWVKEFAKWLPQAETVLYDGKPDERKLIRDTRLVDMRFNVMLTHYDMIIRDKTALIKHRWTYIIVDEGHRLKNKDSKLADVLQNMFSCRFRLLLTGTPIQNNLKELWSLLNFVLPKVFNSSETFDEWFAAPFRGVGEDALTLKEEEELLIIHRLHQVIRPFLLRRKKSEVEKDLPSKTEEILKCDMSAWQRRYYKQITDVGKVNLEFAKSRSLMNSAMQLRKVCIHPYLFLQDSIYEPEDPTELIRASGKFELLDRILPKLKASGHRVLLFSQMTRAMDIIEDYLISKNLKYLRLDGVTKTDDRPRMIAEFNAPDSDVFIFILSTRAGGLGLNLQTADTVVMFDSDWNPQMDRQAEDRAHRIGQRREVKVFVMVTVGTIEEAILERAREKSHIDNKVIQAGMFNQSSSHRDRQSVLQDILRQGVKALGKGVPTESEINRLIARNDDEFELFEKMDREAYQPDVPRLMQEEEVPEWAKEEPEEEEPRNDQEGAEDQPLKPRRARAKTVSYAEALTDHMFLKLVDAGADLHELNEWEERKLAQRKRKLGQDEDRGQRSKRRGV